MPEPIILTAAEAHDLSDLLYAASYEQARIGYYSDSNDYTVAADDLAADLLAGTDTVTVERDSTAHLFGFNMGIIK